MLGVILAMDQSEEQSERVNGYMFKECVLRKTSCGPRMDLFEQGTTILFYLF